MPLVGSSFREHARAASTVAPPVTAEPARPRASQRVRVLALSALTIAGVVALEWYSSLDYSLGIFYVFPIILAGTVMTRAEVVATALFCAAVRGQFMPVGGPVEAWLHFAMAAVAYSGSGLLVVEMSQRRRRVMRAYERLRVEKVRRYRAEDSLRLLAESSPAGIVTLNVSGDVLTANHAAAEMLGFVRPAQLKGQNLLEQVPVLASALRRGPDDRRMRASATSWARRLNGQLFPITVWFSTYGEGRSRCLAGIIVDTSEEVRDREREAFRHFVDYNRLLAGAVAHEIRNMCSAIRVVTANLGRRPGLSDDVDFRALSSLVDGLARIASFELRTTSVEVAPLIDLHQVFDQLRVVIEPDWTDIDGTVTWALEDTTMRVHADAHALLQVFLNLTQNALRATQASPTRRLDISARRDDDTVCVTVTDSGVGVSDQSVLFQPFRPDADGTGLGLYISRTLVRTFGGDLRFVPTPSGCTFEVILPCNPPQVTT